MSIFLGVILTLAVFVFIVIIHELGHFLSAKLFGVRVEEFGIGIPPKAKVLGKDKSGTIYTLNWIPMGGFVRISGEEPEYGRQPSREELWGKPFWQKSVFMLAGVFFNFVLAFILFTGLFYFGVSPIAINTKFDIAAQTRLVPNTQQALDSGFLVASGITLDPIKGGIAESAGIKKGDSVLSVNGIKPKTPADFVATVSSAKGTVVLELMRDKKVQTLTLTPKDGMINSYVGFATMEIKQGLTYKYPFVQAVQVGAQETYAQSQMMLEVLAKIGKNIISPRAPQERKEAVASMSGPIALGNFFVNFVQAHAGIEVLIVIIAFISINLGVFNLLPIPALDGGRFVFLIITTVLLWFTKKPQALYNAEKYIHLAGFGVLIILSILIAFKDIVTMIF